MDVEKVTGDLAALVAKGKEEERIKKLEEERIRREIEMKQELVAGDPDEEVLIPSTILLPSAANGHPSEAAVPSMSSSMSSSLSLNPSATAFVPSFKTAPVSTPTNKSNGKLSPPAPGTPTFDESFPALPASPKPSSPLPSEMTVAPTWGKSEALPTVSDSIVEAPAIEAVEVEAEGERLPAKSKMELWREIKILCELRFQIVHPISI